VADVTDADMDEIALGESVDMIRTPDRISMLAFDMVQEIRRRRAADLSVADRAMLAEIRHHVQDGAEVWADLLDRLIRGRDV
jgi:hypothetical protein